MKRLVAADSSCDMRAIEGALAIAPLTISFGSHHFVDDQSLSLTEFLTTMKHHHGRSTTACPSVQAWTDIYDQADEIFAVTMTSALSGTYNCARVAMEMVKQEHPEKKIMIFDTLSTGPQMRLLIEALMEHAAAGESFADVCEAGREYLAHTRLLYILQSLHNMAENGRVSKLIASAVDILGMRIVATASREGTVQSIAKTRGDLRAVSIFIQQLKKDGYCGGRMRIGNIENAQGAQNLADAVRKEWAKAQILIYPSTGLCSYYAEPGGLMIGYEIA